jgi:valyl-tRNA synthetase
VVHPEDGRHRDQVGRRVRTPLFGVDVPVVAHELADPEKGTGAAMVCTFGDVTDVTWWRELRLEVRPVMGADGTIRPVAWGTGPWRSADPAAARAASDQLAGLGAARARARVAELLREAGALAGEPRPITHPVKFYEKGERPLEILTSRQWFVRTLRLRAELLALGRELSWHPAWMRGRYESWVAGLNSDWAISRQRFFGVPFPVWYPVGDDGRVDYDHPILAPESRLPVDPSSDAPDGYREDRRGVPGGMDTWATSSLTPQIVGGWVDDPDLFERVFPMDLRPQSHEIIRTWLFSTIVRSHLEHGVLPWRDVAISGWVVDPDRKKMSKSRGNVLTPMRVLEQFGSDAARYWAASGRPGVDTTFDEGRLRVGRRLAIKLLNASKFVLATTSEVAGVDRAPVTEPLDQAMLAALAGVVDEVTAALEGYDYTTALERTESFFWRFCDDYLELVKGRAYGDATEAGRASAAAALRAALSTVLRLFAPVLPFVTEEVWSWWRPGSVHRSAWPEAAPLRALAGGSADPLLLDVARAVLAEVRKAKSLDQRSMRWPVERAVVHDTAPRLDRLRAVEPDVRAAGRIGQLVVGTERDDLLVEVALAREA